MNGESWKFSKVISVPSVLSTVGLIVIMVMYVTTIEAEVAVLQSQQETAEKKFDQIDSKLDRLLDILISSGR
jgi:mannose/fructose/N-acetylgalactosamine-specific phosphotransferase system component IID|tara:strand:- start:566 stop:781 length:216 start_codon:yes stop_codon:yes gene_type:complete